MKDSINVALIGMGWAGNMHALAYQKTHGISIRLKTVCAIEPQDVLSHFAKKYGFENWTNNYEEVLQDPEIDVVDIVTPPYLHKKMIIQAFKKNKYVICEKPITGYFGEIEGTEINYSSKNMLNSIIRELSEIEKAMIDSGRKLFYSEQWIYSPPFVRALELIKSKKAVILSVNCKTGHKGSQASHAAYWKYNGGGALIRQGIHPISAVLYMKKKEMENRGEIFGIKSVLCNTATLSNLLNKSQKKNLDVQSNDVEDWAQLIITFKDGMKATILCSDDFLGQIYNKMEVYCNDSVYEINMTPNDMLNVFLADDIGCENIEIMEKSGRNIGWKHALVAQEEIRGFSEEIENFCNCIYFDKVPESDFDLAKISLEVIYLAYVSAEEHKEVDFDIN